MEIWGCVASYTDKVPGFLKMLKMPTNALLPSEISAAALNTASPASELRLCQALQGLIRGRQILAHCVMCIAVGTCFTHSDTNPSFNLKISLILAICFTPVNSSSHLVCITIEMMSCNRSWSHYAQNN